MKPSTKTTGKRAPIDDALARRISDALSSDSGIGGDAELGPKLAADKNAALYAKDLGRIDMWLASWAPPEPTDEAVEALAARIEQRLDEVLPGAVSSFVSPPEFDDDDALRDAAAGLLGPGDAKAKVPVPSPKAMVPRPGGTTQIWTGKAAATKIEAPSAPKDAPEEAKVDAPRKDPTKDFATKANVPPAAAAKAEPPVGAKAAATNEAEAKPDLPRKKSTLVGHPPVALPKKPRTDEVALVKSDPSGEYQTISLVPEPPDSAPVVAIPKPPPTGKLELAPSDATERAKEPPPQPKKATKSERPSGAPGSKKKRKSVPPAAASATSDRISIPVPAGLAPVVPLDAARPSKADDKKKSGGLWPLLAAAAVVGLAVTAGLTFMSRPGSTAPEMGAAATIARSAPSAEPAPATPAVAVAGAAEAGYADDPSSGSLAMDETLPAVPAAALAAVPPTERPNDGDIAAGGALPTRATGAPAAPSAASTGVAREATESAGRVARLRAGGAADGEDSRAEGRAASGGGSSTRGSGDGTGFDGPTGSGAASGSGAATGSGTAAGSGAAAASREHGSTDGTPRGGGGARPPSGPLPDSPGRDAVRDALEGVRPQVEACFEDSHGLAEVAVRVASSGRVTTATVSGRFAGTPIGSCIARAVRGARFPAFSNPSFEVHYQYRH